MKFTFVLDEKRVFTGVDLGEALQRIGHAIEHRIIRESKVRPRSCVDIVARDDNGVEIGKWRIE